MAGVAALDYSTNVHPSDSSALHRNQNWQRMQELASRCSRLAVASLPVNPYSFFDVRRKFEALLRASKPDHVVFDISCLTKIHTMALAAMLGTGQESVPWSVAYSIPQNYGFVSRTRRKIQWSDIIVAPLAEPELYLDDEKSSGVILPGHEDDRLVVAISEVQPVGGCIFLSDFARRPDFRVITERRNTPTLEYLKAANSDAWTTAPIEVTNPAAIIDYLRRQVAQAKTSKSPVVLFPFGSKILVFLSAYYLARVYPMGAWFVYPIPSNYDVAHSEGLEETFWLSDVAVQNPTDLAV